MESKKIKGAPESACSGQAESTVDREADLSVLSGEADCTGLRMNVESTLSSGKEVSFFMRKKKLEETL